jgi:hypothetical protein
LVNVVGTAPAGRHQDVAGLAEEIAGRVAENGLPGSIRVSDVAMLVHCNHAIGQQVEHPPHVFVQRAAGIGAGRFAMGQTRNPPPGGARLT